MKKWLKITITLGILGIIAAGLGYKFVYNKPHKNYEKAEPEFTLNADKIFAEYKSARKDAEQKYNGRVLLITGELNKVEKLDSLTIAIFVLDEGMFGDEGIRFSLLPNHSSDILSYVNKEVAIKGYCAGYNDTDIILEKCSLVAL